VKIHQKQKVTAAAQLSQTISRIDGAYSPSTIRAYRADFEDFIAFCQLKRRKALPASPLLVAEYIAQLTQRGRRSASIRRAMTGIASIHRFNGFKDPTKDLEVMLALRRMHRAIGRYSHQALGVTKDMVDQMVSSTDESLRGLRDRALLLVAYDTLCRRSELLSFKVEDIRTQVVLHPHRMALTAILLRRSKTDPEAHGRWIQITPRAAEAINAWLAAADLSSGPIFRGVNRAGRLTRALDPGGVARIYKRLARKAALREEVVRQISGHSTRVGAAQDLLLSGASLPLIMHRGRWSKSDTVMRYVERLGMPL
jgi:site-specific recombinase XerD